MRYNWNLIFVVQNILRSSDDSFFASLIEEILGLNYSEKIKIHLIVTIHENQEILKNSCIENVSVNGLTSMVFEVIKDSKKIHLLQKKDNLNLALSSDLTILLKAIPHKRNEKKIIITWDHGAGLAFFLRMIGTKIVQREQLNKFSIPRIPYYDERNNDRVLMSIDEFVAAFCKAIPGKVDFLLMMNCYMLAYDNCLALNKKFKYLVAGQSTMAFNGYDYQEIVSALEKNDRSSSFLMSKFVESSGKIIIPTRYKNETANFGFQLNYFPIINILFNLLLKKELKNINQNKLSYLNTRSNYKDFVAVGYEEENPFQFLDFTDTMRIFKKKSGNFLNNFTIFLILMLFKKAKSETCFIGETMEKFNLSGLSLVFPENKERASKDALYQKFYIARSYPSSFLLNSKWPRFLTLLFS